MIRWPLLIAFILTGCASGGGSLIGCDRAGCTPMRIMLAPSNPPAPAEIVAGKPNACVIHTDIPPDTKEPDQYGDKLRHIGESAYQCLTGVAKPAVAADPPSTFYKEVLWFKIDGNCHKLDHSGYTAYGCFDYSCRSINTNLSHIGPPTVCPSGTPMSQWTDACWTQFYMVLGHEITHGWLGNFHQ